MKLWRWKNRFEKWQHKTNTRWQLVGYSLITRNAKMDYCCPLTAEFQRSSEWYPMAALLIGLEEDAMRAIVSASDKCKGYDPKLRAWLLKICGVIERIEG